MRTSNLKLKGGELADAFNELRRHERLSALHALEWIARWPTWALGCRDAELNLARMFARRLLVTIEEEMDRRDRRKPKRRPAKEAKVAQAANAA